MKTMHWMSKNQWGLLGFVVMFLAPQLPAQQISSLSAQTYESFQTVDQDTSILLTLIPVEEAAGKKFGSIYLGDKAGQTNQIGFDNTFIGENTGKNNHSGYDNTFVGKSAGSSNTLGNANTFIGKSAGNANTSGYYNTFLGRDAGAYHISGNSNTFLGRNSGGFHRYGDNNTLIGAETGLMNENGTGNVFLGYKAGYHSNGNNQLFIDNSDTQTPLIWGDFEKDRVGINRIARTNTLEINGTASKTTPGNWSGLSDRRLMEHAQAVNSREMLDKVLQLNAVSYQKSGESDMTALAFDAAQLQQVRPDIVAVNADGYLEAAYGDMDPMLVEAIKALNDKISALEDENRVLKAKLSELATLQAEVENLWRAMNSQH